MHAAASIVIPHYGSLDLTLACVAAIEQNTDDYELVIVDNGTAHDLPGRVIRNAVNEGFARACNQGAAAATTDRIVFLNNDTEPHQGWLGPLLERAEAPRVGAVASKCVYPDGSIQHAGMEIVAHRNGQWEPLLVQEDRPSRDVQIVAAASMLVRRDAFEAAGGFDEGYVNGHEDIDLCLTMRRDGWRVVYEARSVVTHHESVSGPARWSSLAANDALLRERWSDVTPDRRTSWAFLIGQAAKSRLRQH